MDYYDFLNFSSSLGKLKTHDIIIDILLVVMNMRVYTKKSLEFRIHSVGVSNNFIPYFVDDREFEIPIIQ